MTSPATPDGSEHRPTPSGPAAGEPLPSASAAEEPLPTASAASDADEPLPRATLSSDADEPLPVPAATAGPAEPLPRKTTGAGTGAATTPGPATGPGLGPGPGPGPVPAGGSGPGDEPGYEPGYEIAAGGSFAAGYARQHFFSGARFLKPGRRAAVALAAVVAVAAIGVGLAAAVPHLGGGGDDHVAAQPAASTRSLAGPSSPTTGAATATTTHAVPHTPGKPAAHPKPPAHHIVKGLPPATGAAIPLQPGKPAATTTAGHSTTGTKPATHAPQQPAAHPITFKGANIVNFGSSRCLAAQGGSSVAGTLAVLADCNQSDPSQGWTLSSDGTVRDFAGTRCLDISGTPGNGTAVRIKPCSAARQSTQNFVLKPSYDLVEVQPDLCVDAKDNGTAAGTVLQLWSCAGTSNQKWRMP
ncbi:RICIN domain-containing protein [Actinacidiphila acididurans]|uniref:Ricin-type beta-trefoil lectin domain protein n=1 Tax=Actinacidiphila acididurans TaxID=2784346 RepID=A0ABS2TZF2_9ACTN|nr:RICIN domain-containing protein [Actinacidiphila acididurans]MBM9507338.1 ricin-type beta-trefoil lectin domain protein [Actinacidiphila acididurans]